jgi:hypothetical protein
MNFRIVGLASTAACLAILVGTVHAQSVPYINPNTDTCVAYATGDSPGNTYIGVYGDAKIKVVVTKSGRVNAVCHGPDGSGVYEKAAEQGKIEMPVCAIVLPEDPYGESVVYGSGHVVAAANDNDSCFYGGSENCGGNVTMKCSGWLEEE